MLAGNKSMFHMYKAIPSNKITMYLDIQKINYNMIYKTDSRGVKTEHCRTIARPTCSKAVCLAV